MNYTRTNYPDGDFTIKINDFNSGFLTKKINSYDDLWELKKIKDICDHNNIKVNLTIPCLFGAQADRRFNEFESSNLKLICKDINDLKFKSVQIFHPHNPEVVEALIDNVQIISNYEFINEVFEQFNFDLEKDLILMSSDSGGFKPLMKLANELDWKGEVYSASKSRRWNEQERKSELIQQIDKTDFNNKNILIIDDLCVYGGTFIGLSKLLKERNAGKLYLAVSHITVPNPSKDLEIFDKVFTTNSKYDNYPLKNIKVFGLW